jgi:hypothetical protein
MRERRNGTKRAARMAAAAEADWTAIERDAYEENIALGISEAEARAEAGRKVERVRLRIAWADERFNAFLDMQERAGEAYLRQIDEHPEVEDWEAEDAPDLPEPPEEAIAQAIYAEAMAAIERGVWPRHLHFHAV